MNYRSLIIFFVFISSIFNNNICASKLSILVARYNKLINAQTQTTKIKQRLDYLKKELTPFIQDVLTQLEEESLSTTSDSDNEETDSSDGDYDDLTGSDQDFYATLVQFVDDPDYFSPEEQTDLLRCLVRTYRRQCRLCDSL